MGLRLLRPISMGATILVKTHSDQAAPQVPKAHTHSGADPCYSKERRARIRWAYSCVPATLILFCSAHSLGTYRGLKPRLSRQ